jgi:hypothetical protein
MKLEDYDITTIHVIDRDFKHQCARFYPANCFKKTALNKEDQKE